MIPSNFENTEAFPGVTEIMGNNLEYFLIQYLKSRGLIKPDAIRVEGEKDLNYQNEKQLWNDVLMKKNIFESRRIFLEDFFLLEWVPQTPGQYYTEEAHEARKNAQNYIIDTEDHVVFDPYGKAQMIRAGVGCLRFNMKSIGGRNLKFLCATKSGVAHRGFVVAMPKHIYSKVAELVENGGAAQCNITGEIRYWTIDTNLPFYSSNKIPRIYILVEDVTEVVSSSVEQGALDVTAAVAFNGELPDIDYPGTYFTYAHFDPTNKESIDRCVDWIRFKYVEQRYNGKVLTDFDEKYQHFPNAVFPVSALMNPEFSINSIKKICMNNLVPLKLPDQLAYIDTFIETLNINFQGIFAGGDVKISDVSGQVAIGKNITQKQTLSSSDKKELRDNLVQFQKEIARLSLPADTKATVNGDVTAAIKEVENEESDHSKIKSRFEGALDTIKEVGDTIEIVSKWEWTVKVIKILRKLGLSILL